MGVGFGGCSPLWCLANGHSLGTVGYFSALLTWAKVAKLLNSCKIAQKFSRRKASAVLYTFVPLIPLVSEPLSINSITWHFTYWQHTARFSLNHAIRILNNYGNLWNCHCNITGKMISCLSLNSFCVTYCLMTFACSYLTFNLGTS